MERIESWRDVQKLVAVSVSSTTKYFEFEKYRSLVYYYYYRNVKLSYNNAIS